LTFKLRPSEIIWCLSCCLSLVPSALGNCV
jgi:hypothetical protein